MRSANNTTGDVLMLSKRYFKTKDEVEVTFEVDQSVGDEVEWVADANDWEPVTMPAINKGKGPFKLRVRLPKDRHVQFRYRVDGDRWINDEAADAYWYNGHDADNSVVSTV